MTTARYYSEQKCIQIRKGDIMQRYNIEIESDMKKVHNSLNEKDKRIYAAIEAKKMGRGGINYISQILKCDKNTVSRGLNELESDTFLEITRVRKEGGGRKCCMDTISGIDDVFLDVVKDNTAGDPMNEKILWTNLTNNDISEKMKEQGIDISVTVVKQLLKKYNYVKRKLQKKRR